jgi:hypothetical protein
MDEAQHEYQKIWVSKTIVGITAILAVGLRFHSRQKKHQKVGWDDVCSVLSLVFMIADFVCNILEMDPGLRGIPPTELTIGDMRRMRLLSYLTFWFVDACEVFGRLSIIFLYYRIFSIQRWMAWSLRVIGVLSILWMLVLIFVVSFQCTPVAALLDPTIDGKCLNNLTGFLISEVINALLDLALVCLPVKIISKLHLPFRDRIGIAAIFVVGGFVIITSMLRIIFGYTPDQGSILGLSRLSFWTGFHLAFVVISTCLPLFRSYLPTADTLVRLRAHYLYNSVSGLLRRTKTSSSVSHAKDGSMESPFPVYTASRDKSKKTKSSVDEIPLTNISVISEVERFGRSEYHQLR